MLKIGLFQVQFKINIFQMRLGNQNLLQYLGLEGSQLFNQYLNRNTFMIFGKGRPLQKNVSNTC